MANEQNLKPVSSKKEARERGRKGGIASGEARRAKKSLREAMQILMDADLTGKAADASDRYKQMETEL